MKTLSRALFLGLPIFAVACGKFNLNQSNGAPEKLVHMNSNSLALSGVITGSLNPILESANTHVLVVGYSNGQGDQFVRSAVGRAKRYRALYPAHNIVLIGSPEIGLQNEIAMLENFGIKIISTSQTELTAEFLRDQLAAFKQIASLDIFSHSSGAEAYLSSGGGKLGTQSSIETLESIHTLFTENAYATLNGCAAGLFLAPALSRAWKIPVSGALEGTNFQQLHTNNQWYFNDSGRFPVGGWNTTNSVSYPAPEQCAKGTCHRMRPEGYPYHFDGGNPERLGLGFYKFFCASGMAQDKCENGMTLSLIAQQSTVPLTLLSSEDDFETALLDFLCPNEANPDVRASCIRQTEKSLASNNDSYSPFRGRQLQCDFEKCDFTFSCDNGVFEKKGTARCSISAPKKQLPTTYIREYKAYKNGFKNLKKSPIPQPVPQPQPKPTPVPQPMPIPVGTCIDSPMGAASDFQLALTGSWTSQASDIEGRAAIGGNAHLEDYSIGAKLSNNPSRADLIVGGSLWFNRGAVPNGGIVSREISLLEHIGMAGKAEQNPSVDLTSIFAGVNDIAHHIQILPTNGQVFIDDYGIPTVGIRLVGTSSVSNIYNVSGENFAKAHSLSIEQPENSTAIIRISGENISLQGFGTTSSSLSYGKIIFAALDAKSVSMGSIGIVGSIIAPNAEVTFGNGLLTGQLFAKSFQGNGQINMNPFTGCIPEFK